MLKQSTTSWNHFPSLVPAVHLSVWILYLRTCRAVIHEDYVIFAFLSILLSNFAVQYICSGVIITIFHPSSAQLCHQATRLH